MPSETFSSPSHGDDVGQHLCTRSQEHLPRLFCSLRQYGHHLLEDRTEKPSYTVPILIDVASEDWKTTTRIVLPVQLEVWRVRCPHDVRVLLFLGLRCRVTITLPHSNRTASPVSSAIMISMYWKKEELKGR